MKRIQITGLCLAAVFAFSAVAATSALALPDYIPGAKGFPAPFKGDSSEAATLETTGKNTITCTLILVLGAWVATMLAEGHFVFHGCTSKGFFGETAPCTTPGAKSGLILTKLLLFHLYYIKKETKPPVGVLILPLVGKIQAVFNCTTFPEAKVTVEGEVIGELPENDKGGLKQLNLKREALEIVFKQAVGKQEIQTVLLLETVFMEKVHLTSVIPGIETAESGEEGKGEAKLDGGETGEVKA